MGKNCFIHSTKQIGNSLHRILSIGEMGLILNISVMVRVFDLFWKHFSSDKLSLKLMTIWKWLQSIRMRAAKDSNTFGVSKLIVPTVFLPFLIFNSFIQLSGNKLKQ